MKNGRCSLVTYIEIANSNKIVPVKNRNTLCIEDAFYGVVSAKQTFLNAEGSVKINRGTIACMKFTVVRRYHGNITNGMVKILITLPDPSVRGLAFNFLY